TGVIRARSRVEVRANVGGTISRVTVEAGARVSAREILAELKSEEISGALSAARGEAKAAARRPGAQALAVLTERESVDAESQEAEISLERAIKQVQAGQLDRPALEPL